MLRSLGQQFGVILEICAMIQLWRQVLLWLKITTLFTGFRTFHLSEHYIYRDTLITNICHRKKVSKLKFRALALRQSEWRNFGLCVYSQLHPCVFFLHSLWRRASALNVSFKTLYGSQFRLSTHFIILNHPFIFSHRRSTAVSWETYPPYSGEGYSLVLNEYSQIKLGRRNIKVMHQHDSRCKEYGNSC